jgi:hypothetical protein
MEEKTDLNEQSGVFEASSPVLRPLVQAVHEAPKEVFEPEPEPEPEPEQVEEPLSERFSLNHHRTLRLSDRPVPLTAPLPPAPAPVDERLIARREMAVTELEKAVKQFSEVRERALRESESQLVLLAAQIAKRVIGRELSLDPGILASLAVEGVSALSERDRIRVRVGTMLDEDTMQQCTERLQNLAQSCQITYDPSLGPGGCVVESELGFVDESIDSRLDSILNAILPLSTPTGRIE